jgi:hypothetical protein
MHKNTGPPHGDRHSYLFGIPFIPNIYFLIRSPGVKSSLKKEFAMTKLFFVVVLALNFLSPYAQASGCDPSDVYLVKEEVVHSFAILNFNSFACSLETGVCQFYVYRGSCDSDELYTGQHPTVAAQPPAAGYVEILTLRQTWESSCNVLTRDVRGVDIDGVRFRTEDDLQVLF